MKGVPIAADLSGLLAVIDEHDPDLFDWWYPDDSDSAVLRCYCGELVTILGGDRPDITGAHRIHLAEAIERHIRDAEVDS